MAQARRSSAEQSNPTGAHNPSEGQPTEKVSTARSTKAQARKSTQAKDPAAASRKPRGAAASESQAVKGAPGAPMPKGTRKVRSVASAGTLSPAIASSQAPILSPGVTDLPRDGDLPAISQDAWKLLTSPTARFRAWVLAQGSDDDAIRALCAHLVEHRCSLLKFTQQHGFSYGSVFAWVNDDAAPARFDKYARARADRADAQAEEVIDIADEEPLTKDPETGAVTVDPVQLKRNQLRIDARKWHASKMNPRYADRVAVGGDPLAPPIQTAVEHRISFGGAQGAPLPLAEVVDAGRLPAPDSEGGQA